VTWTLEIETRNEGTTEQRREVTYAILRESGKMETMMAITANQLPWFNALRNLIRSESAKEDCSCPVGMILDDMAP
jgi:hypothetical protein